MVLPLAPPGTAAGRGALFIVHGGNAMRIRTRVLTVRNLHLPWKFTANRAKFCLGGSRSKAVRWLGFQLVLGDVSLSGRGSECVPRDFPSPCAPRGPAPERGRRPVSRRRGCRGPCAPPGGSRASRGRLQAGSGAAGLLSPGASDRDIVLAPQMSPPGPWATALAGSTRSTSPPPRCKRRCWLRAPRGWRSPTRTGTVRPPGSAGSAPALGARAGHELCLTLEPRA